MRSQAELERLLARIDGRGYGAYRELRGPWALDGAVLCVDRVQGDPFAAPSRVRLRLPMERAALPEELFRGPVRRTAAEDFLARALAEQLRRGHRGAGSGKSGLVQIDVGGQTVLERTAIRLAPDFVEARLEVGLPAAGRRILGREALRLLCGELLAAAEGGLRWEALDGAAAVAFADAVENQEALRAQLGGLGLVAFVADGAVLPRRSGVSELPLEADEAVPFRSPDSLRVALDLPRPGPGGARRLSGMGIPEGVTLIVGGGYHGKSTLLAALERAVHPHVPGDGRDVVATRADAVKIRAEDGRRVERVDIRAFVGALPGGRTTEAFCSDDASGSTSQAAGLVEALEAGSRLLLVDEDTAATNLMVRDARMQELVAKRDEPITPLVDRVRELRDRLGVSTVLVMGGCGDYFEVADTVIAMRSYRPEVVTDRARAIAARHATGRRHEAGTPLAPPRPRLPSAESLDPARGRRPVKIVARGRDEIEFGRERIDLRAVEQIVDPSQVRAIGGALRYARDHLMGGRSVAEILDALEALLEDAGIDALAPDRRAGGEEHPGNLARPRRFEIAAALNRLRTLRVASQSSP